MTPAARVSAAIDILDTYLEGQPLEKVLTGWSRKNRYAGSGDRAAIRDHVFEAVRCRRTFAFLGGAETGRGLMIGMCRVRDIDLSTIFTGAKYAPEELTDEEAVIPDISNETIALTHDCPDWLLPMFQETLGDDTLAVLESLQSRAPVFLRVNAAKTDLGTVSAMLADDDILTEPHTLSPTALKVTQNARRVALSEAYTEGLVELQDVASQAIVDKLELRPTTKVLDFCAGGGGKSLAIAAHGVTSVIAHDTNSVRMNDLPARALRAGVDIAIKTPGELAKGEFDLVLCDVPCSGSGSWRRSPEAKWSLTPERLEELVKVQADILNKAMEFSRKDGVLAYITCSLFECENRQQVDRFLSGHQGWKLQSEHQISPTEGGDGFYLALLTR